MRQCISCGAFSFSFGKFVDSAPGGAPCALGVNGGIPNEETGIGSFGSSALGKPGGTAGGDILGRVTCLRNTGLVTALLAQLSYFAFAAFFVPISIRPKTSWST